MIKRWWPVTYDFGLVRAEAALVREAYQKQYLDAGMELEVAEIQGSLESCFRKLEPLEIPPTRELFLSTDFGWTAYFRNSFQGSDPFLPMSRLSQQLKTMAMRVCMTPMNATYPAVIWEVYEPPEHGGAMLGHRRTICSANDGGRWIFEQSGEPFPFEQTESFSERRKRDRFTSEMLITYLGELGIPKPEDAPFQRNGCASGYLFSRAGHAISPAYTLEEFVTRKD